MQIKFWGVRGSIAAPGSDTGYFGGNTSCIELESGGFSLILDAGSGLRPLGHQILRSKASRRELHLLLTHFHFDHLTGLPFFRPLFKKGTTLHLYGPQGAHKSVRQIITNLFNNEYFPVPIAKLPGILKLHSLRPGKFKIGPFDIQSFYINHPGRTLAFLITDGRHRIAYVTDHEPIRRFRHLKGRQPAAYEKQLTKRLSGVDLLIHDAQFLDEQYNRFKGWGHSPWSYAWSVATRAQVKQLYFFHHDPDNDDKTLKKAFRRFKRKLRRSDLKIRMAREGMVLQL